MQGVQLGGDRQELHERIRQHSQDAGEQVKQYGRENDLIQRLQNDPGFAGIDLGQTLDPNKYIGRAPQQVDDFIRDVVTPIRERYADALSAELEEVRV